LSRDVGVVALRGDGEPLIKPRDSILSLAARLADYGGGGTNCSLPLAKANRDDLHRRYG
jgi:hypothetical protein